jgi:hypothetical protein
MSLSFFLLASFSGRGLSWIGQPFFVHHVLVGEEWKEQGEVLEQQEQKRTTAHVRSSFNNHGQTQNSTQSLGTTGSSSLWSNESITTTPTPTLFGEEKQADNNHNHNNHTHTNIIRHKSETGLTLDVVVLLSGELGNHLGKIAFGLYLQQVAYEEVGLHLTLRYASQGLAKSVHAKQDLEQCFSEAFASPSKTTTMTMNSTAPAATSSSTSPLDEFHQKDKAYFQTLIQNQTAMIHSLYETDNSDSDSDDDDDAHAHDPDLSLILDSKKTTRIKQQLHFLVDVMERMRLSDTSDAGIPVVESNTTRKDAWGRPTLSRPFLVADTMVNLEMVDTAYDRIREVFQFDDHKPTCCQARPSPTDTVLHHRGYAAEVPPHKIQLKGWVELDPHRTATLLLADSPATGTTTTSTTSRNVVVIISRSNATYMSPYLNAFAQEGISASSLDGQSGVQDFCFLKHTVAHAVGFRSSTFFKWAMYLSDTITHGTLYATNTNNIHRDPSSQSSPPQHIRSNRSSRNYQVKHPSLLAKHFQYPVFTA